MRLSKRDRARNTESVASSVTHRNLMVPDVLPVLPEQSFLCWMCQPIVNDVEDEVEEEEEVDDDDDDDESAAPQRGTPASPPPPPPPATTTDEDGPALTPTSLRGRGTRACRDGFGPLATQALAERISLMVSMISTAAGGYVRRVTAWDAGPEASPMECVSPDHVVQFLATLLGGPVASYNGADAAARARVRSVDLGAGRGALSSAMSRTGTTCAEVDPTRYADGKAQLPHHAWVNADVCDPAFYSSRLGQFDVVVSNPDFEVALQFIYVAMHLVRNPYLTQPPKAPVAPEQEATAGRMIFLLPSDFFEASVVRSRVFKLLNFHIEVEYKLGHLCFYKSAPNAQKLTCDSFFVLRPGRGRNKYEHRVVNARLGGML